MGAKGSICGVLGRGGYAQLEAGDQDPEVLPTVTGSPMSQHHVPSGWRRATSIAYSDIGWGEDTFHCVCISAISPERIICLISKLEVACAAASGANPSLISSRPFFTSPDRFRKTASGS